MNHPRFGFPHGHRLARKEEFDEVLKSPALRLRRSTFRAYVRPNTGICARLGIIIGRRQSPLSVTRNRVKRVIRESFRLNCGRLGCIDVVVQVTLVPAAATAELTGDHTRSELDSLWDEIEAKGYASAATGPGRGDA